MPRIARNPSPTKMDACRVRHSPDLLSVNPNILRRLLLNASSSRRDFVFFVCHARVNIFIMHIYPFLRFVFAISAVNIAVSRVEGP